MVRKLLVKIIELLLVFNMIFFTACLPYEIEEPPQSDENYPPIINNSSHVQGVISNPDENGYIQYIVEVIDYNIDDILSVYWFVYRINDTARPRQVEYYSEKADVKRSFPFEFNSAEYQCGDYYIIKVLISDRGFLNEYGDVPSKEANADNPVDAAKVKTATGFWYVYLKCE